jgi:hypothetical protein
MIAAALICAQVAIATVGQTDSTYASPALRAMIAAAAVANHAPPRDLAGYRARVETELSLILRDTLGREHAAQIEQLATAASWTRAGDYDLHVIGYRSQNVGVPYSALSIVRGWTVPSLYGERLLLGAEVGRANTQRTTTSPRGRRDTLIAVHPFARDRDRYYRFEAGDTIAELHVGGRSIHVARIRVVPHIVDSTRFGAFDGEIELDADRYQIIRMRGQFVIRGAGVHPSTMARALGLTAVAYGEFVNAELVGKYWLPTFQRTEFQASFAMLGSVRSVFRLVSRFGDYEIDSSAVAAAADRLRIRVTWAARDSISRFGDWRNGLGAATSSVHADDFGDFAPDAWRAQGPPRLDLFATKSTDIVRFNRVEGLYTGASATLHMRDLMPGASVGASAGWAWTEQTVRGGATAALRRAPWMFAARAERRLATTTDFALPLDEAGGIAALLGSYDPYDYVDRREARVSATRILGGLDVALVTLQLGVGSDRAEPTRVSRGLFGGAGTFRPNAGSDNGTYGIAVADLEIHPSVSGDFLQPGLGARLHYEGAAGGLDWQRVELALSARRYWGSISIGAHADGGMVFSADPPPQTLFVLGGGETLPGYTYQAFGGDRAALFRGFASYRFPLWQQPVRLFRNLMIPGLGPGLAAGAQGAWTEVSSDATRASLARLRAGADTTARPTNGVRATVGVGLTFFSGLMHLGYARPVDRAAPWKAVVGFGQVF